MKSMSVGSRLSLLVVLFAFLLVFIGGMGLYGLSHSVKNLGVVYEDRLLPASQLGIIARSLKVVTLEFLLGFQHSPDNALAFSHNHALSQHLTTIRDTLSAIDQEWDSYTATRMEAKEKELAAEFKKVFTEYREKIILPTFLAMEKNNLSNSLIVNYLQRRGDMGKKLDDLTDQLLQVQREAGKIAYEESLASYNVFRVISASVIVGGVFLGILGAWLLIRSVTQPLKGMRDAIVYAQETCDFTRTISVSQHDEIGQTVAAFNKLQVVLRATLGDLRSSITSVTHSSHGLSVNAGQSANAAKDTSASATYMASAIQEMTVSISHVGENSKEALELARNAGHLSNEGGNVIRRAVDEINKIAESVREVSISIHDLGTSSQNISGVIRVIKEIADKINLLSLNAAIEAARAGESGRGFAVVADEVRKLAEHTATATLEIEEMVVSIQNCSKEAIASMHQAVERVDTGVELASDAGDAIIKIRNETDHVMKVVQSMSDAFSEQVTVSNDIAAQVERVAQAAEQTSASSRHSSESADELGHLSEEMLRSAEKFHV